MDENNIWSASAVLHNGKRRIAIYFKKDVDLINRIQIKSPFDDL